MPATTRRDTTVARSPQQPRSLMLDIRIRARQSEGTVAVRDLQLPAVRHRRIHIGVMHERSDGLVEVAGGHRRRAAR
jgi:hypothetical protein